MAIAEQHSAVANESIPLTRQAAEWVARVRSEDITPRARTWAKHALLDWVAVTLAAKDEPLVAMLVEELAVDQPGRCTVVGQGYSTNLLNAALINGAASHALDYDDVARAVHGHPSVPVVPVVLALGEELGSTGRDILDAFVVGVEIECRIGDMTNGGHYQQGFHATGTIGTLGAAAAAAKLMKLDADATARALAIAASQAAGLKCNFGTMVKPFHAGKAASNGLLAARLAARGFTANPNALETSQGFVAVLCPEFESAPIEPDPASFEIEKTLFKYHAACYSTHAMLEAIRDMRDRHGITLDDFDSMQLYVHTRHAGNCSIPDPETGLQVKFSLGHLAAMGFDGVDTGPLESYTAENANDPRYVAARRNVAIDYNETRDRMTARLVVKTRDGRTLVGEGDVGRPASDLDQQWEKLAAKFFAIAAAALGSADACQDVIETVASLDEADDIKALVHKIA
ncbi:MAG: MmgE/PrpD family protein [Alphaproteobacteria bacterium]|nr:MmgE/PrpD family protein [Alphaproteobacteria bacterium]